MKLKLFCGALLLAVLCKAQEVRPEDPVTALTQAFSTHQLVLLGDLHGNVQEHNVLLKLIHSPKFTREVNNIVVEGLNSLYQPLVDRYIAGENIPIEQLEVVWRNGFAIGPVADEPEIALFKAIQSA